MVSSSFSSLIFPLTITAFLLISIIIISPLASGETFKGNFDINPKMVGGRPITAIHLMLADYGPKVLGAGQTRNAHADWNHPLIFANILTQPVPQPNGAPPKMFYYTVDYDVKKEYHMGMVIENDQKQKQFYRFFMPDPTDINKIGQPLTLPDFKLVTKLDMYGEIPEQTGDRIPWRFNYVHLKDGNKEMIVGAVADKLNFKLSFCDSTSPTHNGLSHPYKPLPPNTDIRIFMEGLVVPFPHTNQNPKTEIIECSMKKANLPKEPAVDVACAIDTLTLHQGPAMQTIIPNQKHPMGIFVNGVKYRFRKKAAAGLAQQWEVTDLIDITDIVFTCHHISEKPVYFTCTVQLFAISGTRTFDVEIAPLNGS